MARHSGDNFPVEFSEVPSLAGLNTSLYFQMTISPRLVDNVGEWPCVILGPLNIFASTWLMIKMFVLTRTCIFGESSEYVSIVSGYTPWLSYRVITITSKSEGTPVEFNLLKLELGKELLHFMISPIVTSWGPLNGNMTVVFNTFPALATALKAIRSLCQSLICLFNLANPPGLWRLIC